MAKRKLTPGEIAILAQRGCRAESWAAILVEDGFEPGDSFHNVSFSGRVELGICSGIVRDSDGFIQPLGVVNSSLRDVVIGDNCLVRDARVAEADIGDNVILDGLDILAGGGEMPPKEFEVNILTEDGARSVPLWPLLSSQVAHILCHLKNHPAADRLLGILRDHIQAARTRRVRVGSGVVIRRAGVLRNVTIGDGARIEDADELIDCRVEGGERPARVGRGVAARECVFLRASQTEGGVRLHRCLIGEGAHLADGFNAAHSMFFANADFAQGEASSAMAGPFASSHHKATLILTCQCSFNTFGSAANSSNHHFKLGPRHGGVLRRGTKCGSNSYLFWPSDIGAFSTVVGRHTTNLDTADFPFSLILGGHGMSTLVPAVNIFGAGCFRDAAKWRERDGRDGVARPLDLVNPAVLSPYTLQSIDIGIELLRRSVEMEADLRRGGAVIPTNRFEPALRLYQAAGLFHTGERLLARLSAQCKKSPPTLNDAMAALRHVPPEGEEDMSGGRWRDWGGMLLSGDAAAAFLRDVEEGRLFGPEAIRERLEAIHAAYDDAEWLWLARRWREKYGEPDRDKALRFLGEWRKTVTLRHDCFVKDAAKEYNPEARVGFGVEASASGSFRRIRGDFINDPLLKLAERERDDLLARVDALVNT